jgi:hypothetical protein
MAEINQLLHPNLKCLDALLTFYDIQKIQIPFFNLSTVDILLPQNFPIATLDILDKIIDVYQLNVTLHEQQFFDIN